MNIAGLHQWLILSGSSGNVPDQPHGNLPMTGLGLVTWGLVAALCLLAFIGFTVINNHFSD